MTSFMSVFGAVLVLGLCGEYYVHGLEHQSIGAGGERCGATTCLFGEASCQDGQCRCHFPPYTFGNGFLNCYKKNEFRTEVLNDPRIKTFNNNSIDLPIPCRYLLTHAVTDYKDTDRRVVGSCEFMVHAFHKKEHGKFYVHGYDVAIRVECNNGSRYQMSFRKFGWAHKGEYNFVVNATDGEFLPNGPFNDDRINFHDPKTNLRIKCNIDRNNNLASIVVRKCGFRVRFRPYDVKLKRDQPQVPGMTASFSCAYKPLFESVDKVLSLPPKAVHNGFDIDSILVGRLNRMETLMYRAYMSGIEQNQPMPNPACSAARDVFLGCGDDYYLDKAFTHCRWILRSPRFIRCYDKSTSGVPIQELFNLCVSSICGTVSCHRVYDAIYEAGCIYIRGYTEMDMFLYYYCYY